MIYMFLADGFEEIEALCPLDLIRRAGLDIKTVGVGGKEIKGAHDITVLTDIYDREFIYTDVDAVILPGGMPGTLNLEASEVCIDSVKKAFADGKLVAAICAAPSILGHLGFLKDKNAVCFPGFEKDLYGANVVSFGACRDGNIITGAGMGVALEFGLMIVEYFCGRETAEKLFKSTQADRK